MMFRLGRKPLPVKPATVALVSDPGCHRESNEDSGRAVVPDDARLLARRGVLVVVADGMGGHEGGEVASRIAVETVVKRYYDGVPLDRAVQDANREIYRLARKKPELGGMGTTCTALALQNGEARAAHVGDSRLYLVRRGGIYQMTEDHSAVMDMVKQGLLSLAEARQHADRNVLVRALGTHEDLEVATWNEPMATSAGDCFVLCSDGLHDLVSDEEIAQAVAGCSPQAACEALVKLARGRGGFDNITVGIAKVENEVER